MPVVPFSPQPSGDRAPRQLSAAEEPWMLMAAAQMDAQGRLIERDEAAPAEDTTNG